MSMTPDEQAAELARMTDEELAELRVAVLTEQEHRANLARIPEDVAALGRAWAEAGRDPSELAGRLQQSGAAADGTDYHAAEEAAR